MAEVTFDRDELMRRMGPLYPGLIALGCLTVVPLPRGLEPTRDDLIRSALWFPIVGGVMGAILYGLAGLSRSLGLVDALAAGLVLAGVLALTGGLFEVGLMRNAETLFARVTGLSSDPDRRTVGMLALICAVGLRGLGLLGIASSAWLPALVASHAVARWAVLVVCALNREVQTTERTRNTLAVGRVSWTTVAMAGGATAAMAIGFGGGPGLVAVLFGAVVAAAASGLLHRYRDHVGETSLASVALLCELLVLFVFAATNPAMTSPWIIG